MSLFQKKSKGFCTAVLLITFFILNVNAQIITETFDNNNFTSTISSGTYTGDGGIVWDYTDIRSHTYAPPNVGDIKYAVCYNNTSAVEAVYPNGIGYLTFKARSWTEGSNCIFEVRINDTIVGTFDVDGVTEICSITNLEPLANDTLRIQKIGGATRGTFDDIEVWENPPVPSDDNDLASLSNAGGILTPIFDAAVLSYTVELIWGSTLTPSTTANANSGLADVVITDASDVTSGILAERTTTILVTAEDNTTKTYQIEFSIAAPSGDATLSSLSSAEGSLSPVFNASTLSYTVELPYGWTSTPTITATPNHAGAIADVTNATDVTSTIAAERTSTILVAAQDASTETYTVEFNVSPTLSTDAALRSITTSYGPVSPAFNPDTIVYTMLLPMGTVSTPIITAMPNHDSATVVVTAAADVASTQIADRTSTILVTAQDNLTTKNYSVVFDVSTTIGEGEVKHIHASYADDPSTEVYISWGTPVAHTDSYVLFGETTAYGNTENGNLELIKTPDMPEDGYTEEDTILYHHIKLTGLTPNTTYHYKCGGNAGLSDDCIFKTAPAASEKFSFAVLGDIQGKYAYSTDMEQTSSFLVGKDIDFWIPVGDLVDNGGSTAQWDALYESGKQLFESSIIMPVNGNHDNLGDQSAVHYKSQFRTPNNGNPDWYTLYYSFNYSNSLFVVLDGTLPSELPDVGISRSVTQKDFLHNALDSNTQPWKFTFWHQPTYSIGGHGGDDLPWMLTSWLIDVEDYGVEAVFTGHTHEYEVTHPISVNGNPPTVDSADYNGTTARSLASQGTVFYNTAGVNYSGAASARPPQNWTMDVTPESGHPLVAIVTVDMDTLTIETYYYRDFNTYSEGDLRHKYVIVKDNGAATYTLTSATAGNGSVSPLGENAFYENTEATITASADAGFEFSHWTGDVPTGEENANPLTITMIADANVTANFVALPTYTLTVNFGTGSGILYETEQRSVSANTAPVGQEFDIWTGDVSAVADVNASTTTVTMPGADVTITATYKDLPKYTLTITNGTGTGDYLENEEISISPNAAPTGEEFAAWIGDIAYIDNANLATAKVSMPALNISLTATYRDTTTPTYVLTVNDGTGSGSYAEASIVPIEATTINGQVFEAWTGDVSNIADVNDSITTITMPASAVSIMATYKTIAPSVYTVSISVSDGTSPIANASVTFNNTTEISDASGKATFTDVNVGNDQAYSIVHTDYQDVNGVISVIDADVNESVSMTLKPTDVNAAFASLMVYPNPATELIYITNSEQILSVNIYGISNILIESITPENMNEVVIDVSTLNQGMYFLQIVTAKGSIVTQQLVY